MRRAVPWARWIGVWLALVLAVRFVLGLLGVGPEDFAWGGAVLLGTSLSFFVQPSPNEHVWGAMPAPPDDDLPHVHR